MRAGLAHDEGQPLLRPGRQAGAPLSRPGVDRPRARAEPEAAADRPYRPLHHPLAGPDHADRRDDGRARGPEAGRARSARSAPATSPPPISRPISPPAGSTRCRSSTAWSSATSRRSSLPLCSRNGVSILSYSSLALGLLTGKIGPERDIRGRRPPHRRPALQPGEPPEGRAISSAEIAPIAEAHGATHRANSSSPGRSASRASRLHCAGHGIRTRRRRTRAPARSGSAKPNSPGSVRQRRVTWRTSTAKQARHRQERGRRARRRRIVYGRNARRHARRAEGEPEGAGASSSAAASTASARSASWRCRACGCCSSIAATSAAPAARRRRA